MRISDWSSDVCSSDLGHRPFEDEPDPRPLPDARLAGGAVADMFDGLAGCLAETRIEPDLEDLLWNVVNIFHRAGERVERQLDDNEQLQRRLRSEEHTSELQSLMRISYAVFCLKKKTKQSYTPAPRNAERLRTRDKPVLLHTWYNKQ